MKAIFSKLGIEGNISFPDEYIKYFIPKNNHYYVNLDLINNLESKDRYELLKNILMYADLSMTKTIPQENSMYLDYISKKEKLISCDKFDDLQLNDDHINKKNTRLMERQEKRYKELANMYERLIIISISITNKYLDNKKARKS
jgi:Cdc6-like AAA superfamily ATPase